jgi:hypothetical protein
MNLTAFCRLWERRAWRRALIALFGAATAFVIVSGTQRALWGSSEFREFRQIVQVSVVANQDHYAVIPHVRAYPPFFAILWLPFGLVPLGLYPAAGAHMEGLTALQQGLLGLSAFAAISLMASLTVPAVWCIMRAARRQGEGRGWCAPALLWAFSGGLMLNSVVRSETDMFVVMPVAGAMYLMFARKREGWAGALLGLAAAFKLTPGLFGVYLVCRRRWRALGGMMLGGLACTLLLPMLLWGPRGAVERHSSWLTHVIIPYCTEGPETFIPHAYRSTNQSLKAAVVRYLTHYNAGRTDKSYYVHVADLPRPTADRIATGCKLAILGLLVAAWCLTPLRAESELGPLLFALAAPGMVLISDVSVGGHLAILAVPMGALTALCFRHAEQPAGRRLSWGLLAGFLLTHLMIVGFLKALSVGTAGALVLMGVALCALVWKWPRAADRPALEVSCQ